MEQKKKAKRLPPRKTRLAAPAVEETPEPSIDMGAQTLQQKKYLLARSELSAVILDLMKDQVTPQTKLIADTEWKTLVNSMTLEIEGDLIRRVAVYITNLRLGTANVKN